MLKNLLFMVRRASLVPRLRSGYLRGNPEQRRRTHHWIFCLILLMGCQSASTRQAQVQQYSFPELEAEWIRNGEPVEFEGELWFPADGMETLLDAEVYLAGEYKGVEIFIEKRDVRPLNRLYTKFGKNKFRFFEKKGNP